LLEPHDHVAWYGRGTAELYSLASQALAVGSRRREKLLLVVADNTPFSAEARRAFAAGFAGSS
jgi:hypothetical protein